jgi:type I restriction enzyme, S subunit
VRLRDVAIVNPRVQGLGNDAVGDVISFLPLDKIWADARFDASEVIEFSGDVASYNPVAEGDVLVPKVSPTFASGRVAVATGLSGGRALATSEVFVIRPRGHDDARFLAYRLRAKDVIDEGVASWTGVAGLKRISADFLRGVHVASEVWARRSMIADFLDRECEQVRALDQAFSRMSAAATEGLTSQMHDAIGVDRHASVQIRYVARTGTGHTPSRSRPEWWVREECVVPWFTLADVHQIRDDAVDVVAETAERISPLGVANSSAVVHPAGTVLLSRTASVGFSAIMGVDMAVSQDFMTWTCGPRLRPRFLLYALRVSRPELRRLMYGSTHNTIYMPDLLALRVPLPPLTDQDAAVAAIARLQSAHRAATAAIRAARSRLAEYRDALITEAVTGELDVTNVSEAQMSERLHAASEGAAPTGTSAPGAR